MKLRAFFLLSAIALFLANEGRSQSYAEAALMFSRTQPGGSARIQALGGAQISLGGDYSSAYSNPAGLGMFNRSEFTLSVGQRTSNTTSKYFGNEMSDDVSKLFIPGVSGVFNLPGERGRSGYIGGSFAFSYNRVNDFNNSILYSGANKQSSIIQSFILQANGDVTDQFDPGDYNYNTPVGLAYYNYLIGPASTIDPSFPDDEYFTDVQSNFEEYLSDAQQQEHIEMSGATNQWSISYGANFDDRIFVGGGIGISSLRYKSSQVFDESFAVDPVFNHLSLQEGLEIQGSGINATLGAIFRPVDFVQVGLSYTSPTFYNLTETYEASMSTSWKNFDYYGDGETILNNESAGTDILTSEYNFRVPSRISAGVTFISKMGFITGDVEYTNPGKAKYTSEIAGIDYTPENQEIQQRYNSTINIRVGAEFRYKILRVRGGYSALGKPFADNIDNKIKALSGGLGVRFEKFYIDFALIHRTNSFNYSPYAISDSAPIVDVDRKETTGLVTFGFAF